MLAAFPKKSFIILQSKINIQILGMPLGLKKIVSYS